jgi:hypothetical protein
MSKLTRKTGYLVPLVFLGFGGAAFGGPVVRLLSVSPWAVIAMPEPSFPLEAVLTAAGFAGLLFFFRKSRTGPSRNR